MPAHLSDTLQQNIIEWDGSTALVLAAPGCGKTSILAHRVFHANTALGVPFESMLCVTFTNRAAREMTDRITALLGHKPAGLFVGNMHRFCLRFLFANALVPAETNVLDDEDRLEFLSTIGIIKAADVKDFTDKCIATYQHEHDHPAWLCKHLKQQPTMTDLAKIDAYRRFKDDNALIDFDEIILRTYTALADESLPHLNMTGFTWAQVDEVQDMTPLQLAIVEHLMAPHKRSILYLGDEQQAIFSFTGAGGPALDALKHICSDNILPLKHNYRSPAYLVDLCNDMATSWLGIHPASLPDSAVATPSTDDPLVAYRASSANLHLMAASYARRWSAENPEESITVLTRTNAEADELSVLFTQLGIDHFHISKQDVFHQLPFKTLWCHLSVLNNPVQWHPWARLLYQTGASDTLRGAQSLVSKLRDAAISPQWLLHSSRQPYVSRFCSTMCDNDTTVVVLDTETTGLDTLHDEVVQIAALKIRNNKIVEGSGLNIFIESSLPLPVRLADDTPNPLIKEYKHAEKLTPTAAYSILAQYLDDDNVVISGHNIAFDTDILRSDIRRRTTLGIPPALAKNAHTIDTLSLSKLLMPRLRSHKLAFLLDILGIDAQNSHNASDDVDATAKLALALLPLAKIHLHQIREISEDNTVRRIARRFEKRYGKFYSQCIAELDDPDATVTELLESSAVYFESNGITESIDRLDYVITLIERNLTDDDHYATLRQRLAAHIYDLTTYHESDLFAQGIVRERTSVMTIHKAKGLEADNVILYDATSQFGSYDDRARLLYVAFSRARRRLAIGISRQPDHILSSVLRHFRALTLREISVAINAEALHLP